MELRKHIFGSCLIASVLVFGGRIAAQDAETPAAGPPSAQEVEAAITRAVAFIMASPERYDAPADAKALAALRREQRRAERDARGAAEAGAGGVAEGSTPPPRPVPPSPPPKKDPVEGGEWPYEGVYRLNDAITPGYRVGGTAICCLALLEAPGFAGDAARQAVFRRGTAFMLDQFEREPLVQSGFLGNYDVRGWAHAYALAFFLRGLERKAFDEALSKRVRAQAATLVRWLAETEIPEGGGWNYARSGPKRACPASTFMTAPTLQALFQAKKQGFEVNAEVVERGLRSLEEARLETGAFQYGTNPDRRTGEGFEAVPGACARMAVCETTLFLAGRGSVDRIRAAVGAFFEHWEWLEKRRKQPLTHIPPYMIAPYYFHYAHTYVAQAIEQLPEAERPALRDKLKVLYWRTREPDGSWNDRIFDRSASYGCAMVTLGLLMPKLPAPARWER